jgi:HEAT repeat protein
VNVKSKVIWAIGTIASGCDDFVISHLVQALKSNMWKTKSACLFALSQFGARAAKLSIPTLTKLLKESAINKQSIAETIVKLGEDGENNLLRIMSQENDSNYKLKSAICRAFALSNIDSPNIDFIVECLFKASRINNPLIRKNSLFSIRVLAERSQERVTYLKRKNVIPFYYKMLMDKDTSIQAVKIEFDVNLLF